MGSSLDVDTVEKQNVRNMNALVVEGIVRK